MILIIVTAIICIYVISRYRDILLFLMDNIDDDRYKTLVHRLLHVIDNGNEDGVYELLVDTIYGIRGVPSYRGIRYVGDDITCPISMDTISTGTSVLVLPCGHIGKYDAMREWLCINNICPICRSPT